MFDFLARSKRALSSYCRKRATLRDLSALDDRMLKDIGIGRSQIESVAAMFDSSRR